MISSLNKNRIRTICSSAFLTASVLCWTQPIIASDGQSKAIAMQIAEQETKAKAVRAKYKETANTAGYRVRLMKDGKVIHTFISMQRIKQR